MERFKSLSKDAVDVTEGRILEKWKSEDILNKCIENRENDPYFVFYDGPATANGHPGLHHMVAKFLKDTICKYKTMQGYKVLRKVGWDTHGLPVELQVEKALGFKSKMDIEAYGIEAFNKKCKESVWVNEKSFRDCITEYISNAKNDQIHKVSMALGLNETLLREAVALKLNESNLNEFFLENL